MQLLLGRPQPYIYLLRFVGAKQEALPLPLPLPLLRFVGAKQEAPPLPLPLTLPLTLLWFVGAPTHTAAHVQADYGSIET